MPGELANDDEMGYFEEDIFQITVLNVLIEKLNEIRETGLVIKVNST